LTRCKTSEELNLPPAIVNRQNSVLQIRSKCIDWK